MDTTTSMEYSDCVQSKTGKSAVYDEIFRVVETLPISQRERENVVKQIIEIIEREREPILINKQSAPNCLSRYPGQ